jgi:ATP-dependent RNA helicase UAP56/SUB2
MPNVKVGNYFGGLDIKKQRQELKDNTPAIVVGTPGRIKQVGTGGSATDDHLAAFGLSVNMACIKHGPRPAR